MVVVTGNNGSLNEDVLDVGVGCGVSDSKQIKQISSPVDEAGEGVRERVVTSGGSCAKPSMSKGCVAADVMDV